MADGQFDVHLPRIQQHEWVTVTSDARLAGDVERFHAYPTLRRQTVAHHCWNVVRVLLAIWPTAPRHVIIEAHFHDNGELGVGDTPGHSKREHPKLAAALDVAESAARLRQCLPWGVPAPQYLTEQENLLLKLCDTWECMEEALMERMLGNRFADYVVRHCRQEVESTIDRIEDLTVQERAQFMLVRRTREWSV
jgi:hypothetical protein